MNKRIRTLLLVALFLLPHFVVAYGTERLRLSPKCTVRFATVVEGKAIVGAEDAFTRRLSPFDVQSRLHSVDKIDAKEYRRFAAESVIAWNAESRRKVAESIATLATQISEMSLPLPDSILLICTTGKAEAGAPHTRDGAIVLPDSVCDRPPSDLNRLLAHELFHLLSRYNPMWRDRLYAVIGFQPCDEVRLPDDLENRRLTNPDAPIVQHCVEVRVGDRPCSVAPVLVANVERYRPEPRRPFFGFLDIRFIEIDTEGGGKPRQNEDGTVNSYKSSELSGFLEQVGRNTQYMIHPEEILADNFSFLVTGRKVREPELLERIKASLEN